MQNYPDYTPNNDPQGNRSPSDYGYPLHQGGYNGAQPPYDNSTMLADDIQPPYDNSTMPANADQLPYDNSAMSANDRQPLYQPPYQQLYYPPVNPPSAYDPQINYPPQQKSGSKAPLIIAICALICVLIIVGLVIYMVLNSSEGTPTHNAAVTSPTVAETTSNGEAVQETAGEYTAETTTTDNAAPAEEPPTLAPSSSAPSVSSVTSSPAKPLASQEGHTYDASNLLKNDATCWCPKEGSGVNCSVTLHLTQTQSVSGIDIINGYAGTEDQYQNNSKVTKIRIDFSDGSSTTQTLNVKSATDRKEIQHITFDPVETSYVKVTILSISKGKKWDDTCITYLCPTNN